MLELRVICLRSETSVGGGSYEISVEGLRSELFVEVANITCRLEVEVGWCLLYVISYKMLVGGLRCKS